MADVFISYARGDAERARQVVDALTKDGVSVWWDRLIPSGMNWDEAIEAEISNARCVLVLWSVQSVASVNCRCEALFARDAGILIPALIETCTVPLFQRTVQYSDLRTWSGAPDDAGWAALVNRIKTHLKTQIELDPRASLGRWGFGIAPPKPNIWKRYCSAAEIVQIFIETNQIERKESALSALSEVKGLFNRIRRKDQWDWFIVWRRFGFPSQRGLWPIVEALQQLRISVRDDAPTDIEASLAILKDLQVHELLHRFLGNESAALVERGMLFVLSAKNQSDVLFVAGIEGDVVEFADKLSAQLEAKQPFGIIGAWQVDDVDVVKADVFAELSRRGFSSSLDRVLSGVKVVECEYKKALPIIEAVLAQRLG